ncbi:unnamed protein product [Peniophora sp. CBMAI 1063]|nr:unnamed protein product [Peniophora sp. CBMAI 1063]
MRARGDCIGHADYLWTLRLDSEGRVHLLRTFQDPLALQTWFTAMLAPSTSALAHPTLFNARRAGLRLGHPKQSR